MISLKLKSCALFTLVVLVGCTTLDGAYLFDKRTNWARSLTTKSDRSSIMNLIRPLAEDVLSCDQLFKITIEDFNTHENDFKSSWTEVWNFFGCDKVTYFTVQYFREFEHNENYFSYRLLNGAACVAGLRYIDNYKCVRADNFYRSQPQLREKKRL